MFIFGAGSSYSLSDGEWLDDVQTVGCRACPSWDPSVVVCQGSRIESQPGYFAYYTSYDTVQVSQCPSYDACIGTGLINSTCGEGLSVCSNDGGQKCNQGHKGVRQRSASLRRGLNRCVALHVGVLCAECEDGWFSQQLVSCTKQLRSTAAAMSVYVQDALVCKMCPDATLSTIVAVVVNTSVLLIGLILGSKMGPDDDHTAELPNQVSNRNCR